MLVHKLLTNLTRIQCNSVSQDFSNKVLSWKILKEANTLKPQCIIIIVIKGWLVKLLIFWMVLERAQTHSNYFFFKKIRNISSIKPNTDAFDPPAFLEGESMFSQTPQN